MIQQHWNKIVRNENRNKPKVRDYISMSDLGKPYIDRYYKMLGEPITNEFDDRVLRIFDAGRVIEFIVLRALTMAGILHKKQIEVNVPATDDTLPLYGYLDSVVGGFADWENAKEVINKHLVEYGLDLDDELLEQKAISIIEGLQADFPNGQIPETLVEIKSINSMAFWAHKNRDEKGNFLGYPHNKLQLYGYQKGTGIKNGLLVYLSKDDFTMEELGQVLGNEEMERKYQEDIKTISFHVKNKIVPKPEDEMVYNPLDGVFEVNWKVARSSYLTKIYGYKTVEDLEARHHQTVLDLNRALRHLRKAKDIQHKLDVHTSENEAKDKKDLAKLQEKIRKEDSAVMEAWKLEQYV